VVHAAHVQVVVVEREARLAGTREIRRQLRDVDRRSAAGGHDADDGLPCREVHPVRTKSAELGPGCSVRLVVRMHSFGCTSHALINQ
jgi:hypothetical protein